MTQGKPIDRNEIHQLIWDARDRHGKVRIYQKEFAEGLGLSVFHMNRIIREFLEEGRIKKIAARYRNIGIYTVKDPAGFIEVK